MLKEGGLSRARRAVEAPFNMILETGFDLGWRFQRRTSPQSQMAKTKTS